jgi:hypothetical protein
MTGFEVAAEAEDISDEVRPVAARSTSHASNPMAILPPQFVAS